MQFAGQRTDLELNPIGEPVNVLIKITSDVLPEPDAIMLTGITPQQAISEGLTEAEFLKLFYKEVVKPDTIFVGFNSIRFDDEFMRFMHYRNFYDAYEWQWANGCSRWDILDLVRTTRALKPDGIKWPFAPDGKPTNRLGFLTTLNKLSHEAAHDALSDVQATIEVARLVRSQQPELFDHLLESRKKDKVRQIVESGKPFMYTTGRYVSQYLHTSASVLIGKHAEQDYALVYDLRQDPTPFLEMSVDQLIEAWRYSKDPDSVRLPVKTLKYNRCPAIIPGVVSDKDTLKRLSLSRDDIMSNLAKLSGQGKDFADKLFQAVKQMDEAREKAQMALVDNQLTVDDRLYDGFINGGDKQTMRATRAAKPEELIEFTDKFHDARLKSLLPLYKARNFPSSLDSDEVQKWGEHCRIRLMEGGTSSSMAKYFSRLDELSKGKLSGQQQYILEELQLYGQSIIPEDAVG